MMRLMRFRDLEYFIALHEHGNFSAAAEACGISQPAISAQVKRMEGLLGVALFERRHGTCALTPEGHEVLRAARQIMDTFRSVQRTATGEGIFFGRRVAVGILPTVAPYLAPPFLAELANQTSGAGLRFVEDVTRSLEAMVCTDALDFAITATRPSLSTLTGEPLGTESLSALSQRPLPAEVTIDALERPILLLNEGHCFRSVVLEAVRRARARGCTVTVETAATSLTTTLSLVRSGYGDAVVPEPLIRHEPMHAAGLSVAALAPHEEGRTLYLVVRQGRERTVDIQRVADIARSALEGELRIAA